MDKPKWLRGLAILEIVSIVAFSGVGLVVGILTLVFLGRDDVREYFAAVGAEGFQSPAAPSE